MFEMMPEMPPLGSLEDPPLVTPVRCEGCPIRDMLLLDQQKALLVNELGLTAAQAAFDDVPVGGDDTGAAEPIKIEKDLKTSDGASIVIADAWAALAAECPGMQDLYSKTGDPKKSRYRRIGRICGKELDDARPGDLATVVLDGGKSGLGGRDDAPTD